MNDLTLLYYTANTLSPVCADNVRRHLLSVVGGRPVVSVSQFPIDFGENICVGKIGRSYYNCYKQIFIGAQAVRTKYVACCEDDALYTEEHFDAFRPLAFGYNTNMWYAQERHYWRKTGFLDTGMWLCLAATEAMLETLRPRYEQFPRPLSPNDGRQRYFQEPGRSDSFFGLLDVEVEHYETKTPQLVFNYHGSLGGKRTSWGYGREFRASLEPWGDSRSLWRRFWKPS